MVNGDQVCCFCYVFINEKSECMSSRDSLCHYSIVKTTYIHFNNLCTDDCVGRAQNTRLSVASLMCVVHEVKYFEKEHDKVNE